MGWRRRRSTTLDSCFAGFPVGARISTLGAFTAESTAERAGAAKARVLPDPTGALPPCRGGRSAPGSRPAARAWAAQQRRDAPEHHLGQAQALERVARVARRQRGTGSRRKRSRCASTRSFGCRRRRTVVSPGVVVVDLLFLIREQGLRCFHFERKLMLSP